MVFIMCSFSSTDKVHKHEILVDTEAVLVEIWDTCMVIINRRYISHNVSRFERSIVMD